MVTLYGIKNCDTIKRLAVGWKPITSTIVFMITASMGWTAGIERFINELGWKRYSTPVVQHGVNWTKPPAIKSSMRPLRRH